MTLDSLFDQPLYEYTDEQAVHDGVLIPLIARSRDTGHRITATAWHALTDYHKQHGYPAYQDKEFYRFFFAELLPLVPAAHHGWQYGGMLKTDYTFSTERRNPGLLWYVPNERGGITMMCPEDY